MTSEVCLFILAIIACNAFNLCICFPSIPKMDSGLQRPQSALARGVQITELSDGCMNPEPIVLQEADILMEQYLSPTKLVRIV